MPLHLLPADRRSFLKLAASGALVTFVSPASADDSSTSLEERSVDPTFWALISDTHVSEDASAVAHGVNMYDHFNRVVDEVLAEPRLPAGVIVNGDCAYLKGKPGDYANFKRCVDRLAGGGITVHMTMGNHDDRGPFYDTLADQRSEGQLVEGKHVAIIETPHANLFLMDSLQRVDNVTGEFGLSQLAWLDRSLASRADKPALIIGHHNPQFMPAGSTETVTGLADTSALYDTLHRNACVQGYVYGHTHDWKLTQTAGKVHLINLPPTAYVFDPSRPSGWVKLDLEEGAMALQLRSLDTTHVQHGEKHRLTWS